MTAPDSPPPPGGPGREHLDAYELLLDTVGCEVVDPIAEATAAAAPPLTDEQRTAVARIFAGGMRRR
jgi:hypothetical protein